MLTNIEMANPDAVLAWLNESPKKKERHAGPAEKIKKRARPGRPSVTEEFPSAVEVARNFITTSGFKAHRRRQTEVGTACGATLGGIRDHLHNTVPGLKDQHPQLSKYMFKLYNH